MRDSATALEALIEPHPLTLGQLALLERAEAPILRGDVSDLATTAKALYILTHPAKEVITSWQSVDSASLEWLDTLSIEEYRKALSEALDSIKAFYELLPPPTEASKKKVDQEMEI